MKEKYNEEILTSTCKLKAIGWISNEKFDKNLVIENYFVSLSGEKECKAKQSKFGNTDYKKIHKIT